MTETEKLLICAKAVANGQGYLQPSIETTKEGYWKSDPPVEVEPYVYVNGREYNPLTNDAQAYELEGALLKDGWILSYSYTLKEYQARHPISMACVMGKDRKWVAVNAVVDMSEGK